MGPSGDAKGMPSSRHSLVPVTSVMRHTRKLQTSGSNRLFTTLSIGSGRSGGISPTFRPTHHNLVNPAIHALYFNIRGLHKVIQRTPRHLRFHRPASSSLLRL